MHDSFVAEEFIKLMMLSMQKDTDLVPARNGVCLCKQDFAALYTVEAVVVTATGLERFCALIEKNAEDSIHDENARRVMRTYIIVPGEQKENGEFCHVTGEDFVTALTPVKKKCEKMGFLVDIAVADFVHGQYYIAGGGKLSHKKVAGALVKFIEENGAFGDTNVERPSVTEKLKEKQKDYEARKKQAGRIKEVRAVNPLVFLILTNLVIYILGIFFEVKLGYDPLLAWGIQDNELIRQGEVWRLFTSMFLHADAAHLFGNLLMLLYLGRIALNYYTTREFFAIYYVSGIVGNLLSFFFTDYLSLGASGAIMGLGGMLIYRMFFGKYAKSFRMAGNYAVVAIMVVFNLFYGVFAVYENIDNFGHFGGFFGGFVMAWLIYLIRKKQSDKKTGRY